MLVARAPNDAASSPTRRASESERLAMGRPKREAVASLITGVARWSHAAMALLQLMSLTMIAGAANSRPTRARAYK